MKLAMFLALTGMALDSGAITSKTQFSARPLTTKELTTTAPRLDPALVPGLSGRLNVDSHQSFAIASSAYRAYSFFIEPVLYESQDTGTGNTSPRCGIFSVTPTGNSVFLPTLGYSFTEHETCTKLEGVGFTESNSAMPRILLLYSASSPNFSTREPIVLDWNAAANRYESNRDLSVALTHHGGNASISAMKHRIKELASTLKQ